MKKALILGALAGQVDAVEALRQRGVETHVCAHVQGGPGVGAADYFHLVDITNVEQVTDLARTIGADIVYSVGSDIAMPTVVRVSDELGLPNFHGIELTDLLRRKQEIRLQLQAANLSPVRFVSVPEDGEIPDWDVFPSIVKPVDSQGQRGITIVRAPAELSSAVAAARENSVSGPVIVEEFLEGPEVSAHVIVAEGRVALFLPSDRHVWDGPAVGVPEAHSLPLKEETSAWESQFRTLVEEIITVLGVEDGPLYVQSIFTDKGPRIVEIASRLDGCHLWRLLKLSTGFDLLDAVLGRLLGDDWPQIPETIEARPMTLEFFLDAPDTVVTTEYVRSVVRDDALLAEVQVAEGEQPRRTNDVVARIGYQVHEGI